MTPSVKIATVLSEQPTKSEYVLTFGPITVSVFKMLEYFLKPNQVCLHYCSMKGANTTTKWWEASLAQINMTLDQWCQSDSWMGEQMKEKDDRKLIHSHHLNASRHSEKWGDQRGFISKDLKPVHRKKHIYVFFSCIWLQSVKQIITVANQKYILLRARPLWWSQKIWVSHKCAVFDLTDTSADWLLLSFIPSEVYWMNEGQKRQAKTYIFY